MAAVSLLLLLLLLETFALAEATTISVHGDSLSSCNGVSADQTFAYLSFREPLWKEHLSTAVKSAGGGPTMVGKRGCNRLVDARFPNATSFPNFHDAYFGRTAERMLQEWRLIRDRGTASASSPPAAITSPVGTIALVLVGTNDLLLRGKANASRVVEHISEIVHILWRFGGARHILIGVPPDIDVQRARISQKKAARWREYLAALQAGLEELTQLRQCNSLDDSRNPSRLERCYLVSFAPRWNPAVHTYDGVHPNTQGERVMAQCWAETLLPILRSLDNHQEPREYGPTLPPPTAAKGGGVVEKLNHRLRTLPRDPSTTRAPMSKWRHHAMDANDVATYPIVAGDHMPLLVLLAVVVGGSVMRVLWRWSH